MKHYDIGLLYGRLVCSRTCGKPGIAGLSPPVSISVTS
jgi:hypothetical protein